jgi:hypothetical protein
VRPDEYDGRQQSETVRFAHNSERQFAKLLDFYQIEWEYEPRSFDIEWDEAGEVVKKFTPDFYLPQYDLFIEITTLDQRLVTKKNRKVRRLRELYPDIKCKVFYERDYLNLLVKYGLEEPAQKSLVQSPRARRGAPPGGGDVEAEGDDAAPGEGDVSSAL